MALSESKAQGDAERRSYRQFCGLARALDVLGERWTLLLVRNLLLGPRRYSDLLGELPGITTNLLARRLSDLEAAGVVERLPPARGTVLYALTPRGLAIEPAIMELARWGGPLLAGGPRPDDRMDVGWALLSLKRRYRMGSGPCVVALTVLLGGEPPVVRAFELELTAERLEVREREAHRPDVALRATPAALQALLFRAVPLVDVLTSGGLAVERGDPQRLLDALLPPLPLGSPPG